MLVVGSLLVSGHIDAKVIMEVQYMPVVESLMVSGHIHMNVQ